MRNRAARVLADFRMTPDATVQGSEERSMSNEGGEDGASAGSNVSASGEQQNKRRKTGSTSGASGSGGTGVSSRGVANLTPEQLAKKRANDREAQRSIRQRTKNQIESYERKIRELTSQQPYQELQHVMRQKEMVEAENLDIKKRLSQVISLIQPILGSHGFEAPTQYSSPSTYPPPNRPGSANRNVSTPNSINSPGIVVGPSWPTSTAPTLITAAPLTPFGQDMRSIVHLQQAQQLLQQRHEMTHNLDMGPERLGLDFLLEDGQRVTKIPNPPGSSGNAQESPNLQQIQKPMHHRSNSTASASTSFNTPNSSSSEMNGHSAPIRNSPPTCPLDSLLLDFLHERQAAAASGLSTPKLVGPCYPSVSSLLNPSRSAGSHPVSKVFTDILGTFPDLSTLPEKVAVLYIMFLLMRWQIHPSRENYDRLPTWITPRPSQLFTPHPAWIDHLPFPKMRDILVRDYNPRDYLFDNFFIPFTSTLSLNWPYEPTDTLLSAGAGGEDGELVINPVFERHMRRLENWSLGPAFASAFPGLKDTYRLKTDGDRR